MRQLSLTDPIVIKGAGGLALYFFGGSELCKLAGLGLAGWAALEYFTPPAAAAARSGLVEVPADGGADAAGRLPGELFYGWPAHYTPSVRPARPGEARARAGEEAVANMDPAQREKLTDALFPSDGGGKVIPMRGGDDG